MPHCKLAVAAASTTGKTSLMELFNKLGISAQDTEVGDRDKEKLKQLRRSVLRGEKTWDAYHQVYNPVLQDVMEKHGDKDIIFAHTATEFGHAKITYDRLVYLVPADARKQVIGGIARFEDKNKYSDGSPDYYVDLWTTIQLFSTNMASVMRQAAEQTVEGAVIEFNSLAGAASALVDVYNEVVE